MSDVKTIHIPIDDEGHIGRDEAAMLQGYTAKLVEFEYKLRSSAIIPREGGGRILSLVYQEGASNGSQGHVTNSGQGIKLFYRR